MWRRLHADARQLLRWVRLVWYKRSGTICCGETGYYCDQGQTCAFDGFSYCETGNTKDDSSSSTATQSASSALRTTTVPAMTEDARSGSVQTTTIAQEESTSSIKGPSEETVSFNEYPLQKCGYFLSSEKLLFILSSIILFCLVTSPMPCVVMLNIFAEWKKTGHDIPEHAFARGVSEAEYVGSFCGSPLELVKCETNDICVPTNSEIVLEGTISTTDANEEGPHGEMHGYSFLDENSLQPIYNVNAITHRTDSILPVGVPGCANLGPDETQTMIGTFTSAEMRNVLQEHGFPANHVFALFETHVIWATVQVDLMHKKSSIVERFCHARIQLTLQIHSQRGFVSELIVVKWLVATADDDRHNDIN
ncbi:3-octaprenyl-4-hydroxybenzoate carboxy-lyase-domain-containing protein [Stachybotrys elegans]|uniref:3-octaprenyl-4-hydroxybenzoate carboxy-lyase-domain-containing protein n=1 Tax=Stachybotrys elegans TaxID=80388 RepID=A0A8K0SCD2_9HYPO|nr:3-octaprenyl-4-hydroxybenzoate carboxy-lyase-domain-containing protein [Stachybotrys elegans]